MQRFRTSSKERINHDSCIFRRRSNLRDGGSSTDGIGILLLLPQLHRGEESW
jgi:hypothetical protein